MPKQVVFIMVDSQRQDMLSCYDKDAWRTPHLDELATHGTLFTKGYTCQPVCGPARSALFTGLYPHSNGMWSNSTPLGANVKTAGDWLSESTINCGYIGKWHLDGGDYFGYGKCPSGYDPDYWYDMRNYLDELSPKKRKASRVNMSTVRCRDITLEDTFAHRCSERAIRFIDAYQKKDFFLTVSYDEPHDPSQCPKRYRTQLKRGKYHFHKTPNVTDDLSDKPAHQKIWAKNTSGISFEAMRMGNVGFLSCNRFVDDEIGSVLEKIKSTCPNAMIIYTADHGELFLSHRLVGKGAVMYDEITKVPFIIKGDGFPQGVSDSTPVSHIDLLPTVMEYLGVPIPRMLQGKSLFTVEKNNSKRDVFMEFGRYEVDHDGFMGFQPIRCIFDGQYKLVINLLTSDELYDLKQDPYEMKNLIADLSLKAVRNALHDRLIEQMNVTRDPFRGYYWHCRPWRNDVHPSFQHTGYTRQLVEEDFVQLDYSTGLPMESGTRKK